MKTQWRASGGESFWNFSGVSLKALEQGKPDFSDDPLLQWQGRIWLCKHKDISICEVVGYQIAEALELPLQPWITFFQNEKAEPLGSRKVARTQCYAAVAFTRASAASSLIEISDADRGRRCGNGDSLQDCRLGA
jgi:hypothetical protein